jgi:hypothetical protein
MNVYQDLATALQAVKRNFIGGKTLWVSFQLDEEKVARKGAEWVDLFGTNIEPWRRQKLNMKKRPTAKAVCGPAFLNPAKRQVFLQVTEFARVAPPDSSWARENWSDRLPVFGPFVLVREPNNQRCLTWTWKLTGEEFEGRSRYLVSLVKARNAAGVRNECEAWSKLYPMESGVRRQLRALLVSSTKLWNASHKTVPWPSITPSQLPMAIGFRSDRGSKMGALPKEAKALKNGDEPISPSSSLVRAWGPGNCYCRLLGDASPSELHCFELDLNGAVDFTARVRILSTTVEKARQRTGDRGDRRSRYRNGREPCW